MPSPQQLLAHAEWLLDQRWLPAALIAFNAAESHGAEADRCRAGRWMVFTLLGRFEEAWREGDAIRRRGMPDPHRFWNGEDISGKHVIVRCLHGFGDSVQFLRYIPLLKQRAARVIVEVHPRFVQLARTIRGVDQVITWGEAAPAQSPRWDVQIEVTELPWFFRTQLSDLPLAANYLNLPAPLLRDTARAFPPSNRMRIGIVWSCGEWNLSRSIPLSQLEPLLRTPGCEFWNLQGGEIRSQWSTLRHLPHVYDASRFCADAGPLPLACFIAQLDLVITVDTLAAHLAGALGVPTWVMLRHQADWRWMVDREDSPWYPSVRLFRQNRSEDWSQVVRQIQTALPQWIAQEASRKAVA